MTAETSPYTNPAGAARESGEAYTAAVLELLADADPMAVLAELPSALEALVAGVPDAVLGRPEREGKWSVAQVLWHLADSEVIYRYRLRRVVAEGGTIVGYDQDAWADRLRYADEDPDAALDLVRALRPATVRWLTGLTAEERARHGRHEERGPESVDHMVRLLAGHDLVHRRQIRRILDAVG